MTAKIWVITLTLVLLAALVGAECEKEKEELDNKLYAYNDLDNNRIADYNKGDTSQACSILVYAFDVFRAYSDLSECYYNAGNHSLSLEYAVKMEEWGEKYIEWGDKCGLNSPEENKENIYWIYVAFYDDLRKHDCSLLNKSVSECLKFYNENSDKSCYYCKEYNKLAEQTLKKPMTCKYHGCLEEEMDSRSTSTGSKENSFPIIPVAIGVLVLILALAFFLLKGKKRKS